MQNQIYIASCYQKLKEKKKAIEAVNRATLISDLSLLADEKAREVQTYAHFAKAEILEAFGDHEEALAELFCVNINA